MVIIDVVWVCVFMGGGISLFETGAFDGGLGRGVKGAGIGGVFSYCIPKGPPVSFVTFSRGCMCVEKGPTLPLFSSSLKE